jgi:hypothetical protein
MTTNVLALALPSDVIAVIDRLAKRELEPRSAWARRVILAELRRLETEGPIPKPEFRR